MTEILVRGQLEARVAPTEARIDVMAIGRDAKSQDGAMGLVAERCGLIDSVIGGNRKGRKPLIRTAETASISTSSEWETDRAGQRRRRGYVARRTTRLVCAADSDGLTALITALSHDGIELRGPNWQVGPEVSEWDGLRTEAVADAKRRADAYAAGVGATVGGVRWIAEPGLRAHGGGGMPSRASRTAMSMAEEGGEAPRVMTVSVEPVVVTVIVEAAFDLIA